MNLFVTSDNTKDCVRALDDSLLNQTIIEASQMLSTAIILNDSIKNKPEGLYKVFNPTEEHNLWVRASRNNFKWTSIYLMDALVEYNRRFGVNHKCWNIVQNIGLLDVYFPDTPMQPFPRRFSKELPEYDKVSSISDTFNAYKEYLKYYWKLSQDRGNKPIWTKAERPDWAV